jgi:dipeptidyl aminopeptidase/acylaminoacyl peptidase
LSRPRRSAQRGRYGFDFKNQYFAANGYFVLEVNFRKLDGLRREVLVGDVGRVGHEGRTGRDVGRRLRDRPLSRRSREGGGDWAFVWRVHDELADHAVSRPIRGAASGAGIANWTSDYANSDIPRTKETEFWGAPSDPKARETMIRQSPITYANRVRTPTLFINGEIDKRVPFSENEQLYVAIKKQGVPAKMIQYAGQPHGIRGLVEQRAPNAQRAGVV